MFLQMYRRTLAQEQLEQVQIGFHGHLELYFASVFEGIQMYIDGSSGHSGDLKICENPCSQFFVKSKL
jgi:hypothetical protein